MPTSPGEFRLATFAMAFLRDTIALLPPLRPVQDLRLVPVTRLKQVYEHGAHLGYRPLRLFFPPTAAVAAPGTPEPAATGRCGDATPPSRASHTRPVRIPLWPPRNSARPTSDPHAHRPASPKESPPVHWS